MGGTQIGLYQSSYVGVDIGRPRYGLGSASPGQSGAPPSGTLVSPIPASQAGAGPASPSIGNLSEAAGGFETTIRGQPVMIAYPFS